MIIAASSKELILIYHSDMPFAEKLLAYAAANGLVLREIDLKKENLSAIEWEDLVNTEHTDFEKTFGNTADFSEDDWLKVLTHNPQFLKHPVAIKDDEFRIIDMYSKLAELYPS